MKATLANINKLFQEIFRNGSRYIDVIGTSINNIPKEIRNAILKEIPRLFSNIISSSDYDISGGIGIGRTGKTPWVAVLNTKEAKTPQEGIYIVFLLSSDMSKVYLTLAQGVKGMSRKKIREHVSLIRHSLQSELKDIPHSEEKLDVRNKEFLDSVIVFSEWDTNKDNSDLFNKYINLYVAYLKKAHTGESFENPLVKNFENPVKASDNDNEFAFSSFMNSIKQTNLIYPTNLLKRYVLSLLSKPFVILSGLAGSGKTQLALAFAKWIVEDQDKQIAFVPVGADWTNREALLGYPNGLNNKEYVKPDNSALDVILRANNDPDKPYFLILDEMNLSYVERYFADFLSAMEAHEKISLWQAPDNSDVPAQIYLPSNLFIVGTINVDETTYMFSPKVLDRANVLEFKISTEQMSDFLNHKVGGDQKLDSKGKDQASSFVNMASHEAENLPDTENEKLVRMLISNFEELKKVNAEFGFRSAREIYRFVALGKQEQFDLSDNELFDFAIVQKLLPKLHGSRKKVEQTLKALWQICLKDGEVLTLDSNTEMPASDKFKYPESADKLYRMYRCAVENGFTSYAES